MDIRRTLTIGAMCICFALAAYGQSADQVINAYIDAIGGKAAVDSVKSIRVVTSMHDNTYSPDTKGYVHYRMKPNFYRLDSVKKSGEESRSAFNASSIISVDIAADGNAANYKEKDRTTNEPSWAMREADLYFQMGPFINYADKGITAEYLGKEAVDGKEMHIVKVTWPDDYTINYYFDAKTGLLAMNKRGTITAVYSDYRKAGPVLMPHSIKEFGTLRSGKEFSYIEKFGTVEVNTLSDKVFTEIK